MRGEDATRRDALLLAVLTAGALLLRLHHLGRAPFWVDELLSWRQLHPPTGDPFWVQVRDTVQGTLYLAVTWPLRHATPPEWWLRLPAALAGALAVPAGWRLGRLADRATGWWLAVLLAINPFSLWYSQEVRGYTLMILLGGLATLAWWRAAREGITPRRAVAYALLAWLAGLGNMAGYLLVAAQAACLPLVRPRGRRAWGTWLAAYAAVAFLALPWLLQALGFWYPGRLAPGGGELPPAGQERFSWLSIPYTWFSFLYGFSLGPSLAELHRPDRLVLVRREAPLLALAALPAVLLAWRGWRRFPRRERSWWLLQVALPVAGLVVLRLLDVKTFTPRYLSATLPLVLWLPACGLAGGTGARWRRPAAALLLALTLLAVGQYHGSARYRRDDLRAAARRIESSPHDGDPVLVPRSLSVLRYYYRGRGELRDFWHVPPVRDPAVARRLLAERIGEAEGAWLVLCRWRDLDPRGLLERELRATGTIDEEFRFSGGHLLHWRRPGAVNDGEEDRRGRDHQRP